MAHRGSGAWAGRRRPGRSVRGVAGDPGERDVVGARLAVVGRPPAGWVPGRPRAWPDGPGGAGSTRLPDGGPAGGRGHEPDEGADDGAGDSARDDLRDEAVDDAGAGRRALAAAMASYTAAHGHPLEGPDVEPGRIRLAMRARVALAALIGLLLVAGVVALRVGQRTPTLEVPLPSSAGGAAGAGGSADGADGSAWPGGAGAETGSGAESGAGAGTGPGDGSPGVVVHVVGAVAAPGVVRLPVGARVADAVEAAGGATADADLAAVNLARVLADGEQVVVPLPGQVVDAAGAGTGGPASAGGTAPLDLNRADAAALDALPGIGPVLADRIVTWREDHGRFTAVAELTEVSGIGPSLLAGLRDLVRVG